MELPMKKNLNPSLVPAGVGHPPVFVAPGMKTRRRLPWRAPRIRAAVSLFAFMAPTLLACTASHPADTSKPDEPVKECEQYASCYEAALSAAGPDTKELAHRRASATRDAFAESAHTVSNRAELRKTCLAALAQLHCH
jgi:hypothetical protein